MRAHVCMDITRGVRLHTFSKENKLGGEKERVKATNFKHYTVSTWHRSYKSLPVFIHVESVSLKPAC